MDYEKKYKEALKAAISAHKDEDRHLKATLERIFPELKEGEDEKIRKEIMEYVKNTPVAPEGHIEQRVLSRWLAWLEKQEGCEYIKKDWLEHIKQSWYKEGFIDGKYSPKELTINDVTTLNELIDFLENGTAKLQHDLALYANWLKTQFPPNEKQGKQKPTIEMKSAEESLGIDSETYNKIVDECTDSHVLSSEELQKYYKNNIEE